MTATIVGRAISFTTLLVSSACVDAAIAPAEQKAADPLRAALIAQGYRSDLIEDRGSYFLVEKDIVIRKSTISEQLKKRTDPIRPLFQAHTDYLLCGGFGNGAEGIDGRPMYLCQLGGVIDLTVLNESPGWLAAARAAIAAWNAIPGSWVSFSEPIDEFQPTDITVSGFNEFCDDADGCTAGYADFPTSEGKPGPNLGVNFAFGSSQSQRELVFAHELGHTIGFRHTDWAARRCGPPPFDTEASAHPIPLTPTEPNIDFASVMMACNGGDLFIGFSDWDKFSIRWLYRGTAPGPTATANGTTVQLSWSPFHAATSYKVYVMERWWESDPSGFGWAIRERAHYHGTTTSTNYSLQTGQFSWQCYALRAVYPNPVVESYVGPSGCANGIN